MKDLLQTLQVYGLTPLCSRMCSVMLLRSANAFWQTTQVNGFSPVWIRRCCFSSILREKDLLQCGQTCGFSPVWIRTCMLYATRWLKLLPQYSHPYSCTTSTNITGCPYRKYCVGTNLTLYQHGHILMEYTSTSMLDRL